MSYKKIVSALKSTLIIAIIVSPLLFSQQSNTSWGEEGITTLIDSTTQEGTASWSIFSNGTVGDSTYLKNPTIIYPILSLLKGTKGNTLQAGNILIGIIHLVTATTLVIFIRTIIRIGESSPIPYIVTFFFLYSPYRLNALTNNSSLAENLAIALIPLLLTGLFYLIKKEYKKGLILTGIVTTILLATSLNISFLVLTGVFITAIIFSLLRKDYKIIVFLSTTYLYSLLLTVPFWLPLLRQFNTLLFSGTPSAPSMLFLGTLNEITLLIIIVALLLWGKTRSTVKVLFLLLLLTILALPLLETLQYAINENKIGVFFNYISTINTQEVLLGLSFSILIGLSLVGIEKTKFFFGALIGTTLLLLPLQPKILQPQKEHSLFQVYGTYNSTPSHIARNKDGETLRILTNKATITDIAKNHCKNYEYAPTTTPYTPAKEIYLNKDCSSLIGIYIAPQDREKIESVDITTQTITVTLKKDKEDSITLLQRNNTQWETTSGIREEELGYLVINNITEKTFTLSQRPLRSVLLGKIISGATLLTLLGLLTYFIIKKQNNGKERTA